MKHNSVMKYHRLFQASYKFKVCFGVIWGFFSSMSAEGGRVQRTGIQKEDAYKSCAGESLCQIWNPSHLIPVSFVYHFRQCYAVSRTCFEIVSLINHHLSTKMPQLSCFIWGQSLVMCWKSRQMLYISVMSPHIHCCLLCLRSTQRVISTRSELAEDVNVTCRVLFDVEGVPSGVVRRWQWACARAEALSDVR